MTRRHTIIGIAGLALALIGLLALAYPVYLDQFDLYGVQVACGNGFSADLNQAAQAHLATRCDTALIIRRAWAIPTVAVGSLLIAAFLLAWVRAAQPEKETSSA
ncbi:hypothetical protein OQ968_22830 [Mycobacterium sp. 663a-19]|uniref:hypothetical protein n=1 Tax=Mycobacterium sp. 663a-19 TaxID=2986148 RepID=UPI002D1ECFCD|nr:hypothetical protein [Mycobacterium sp. 663a-19]MEB3984088.1 hypothetical protein [Mycobacterium sp. 663a-19]